MQQPTTSEPSAILMNAAAAAGRSTPCAVEFYKFCRCESIFETKYLRTHRAGGTKVLRCFPHCCPEHVFNSVCGSSIVTRVHGDRSILGHSITYLRFEASYDNEWKVGDTIPEHVVLANVRRQTHSVGEWITSHYDGLDEVRTSIPEISHLDGLMTRVSEFSPKASLGWHYRWIGGSARLQRQAMHTLRAYVVVRINDGPYLSRRNFNHPNPVLLRVIATATSPPFIVMSYRRACKTCQRQNPEDIVQCQCEGIYRIPPSHTLVASSTNPSGDVPSIRGSPVDVAQSNLRHDACVLPRRQLRQSWESLTSPTLHAHGREIDAAARIQLREMEVAMATVHSFAASFPLLPAQGPHFTALWTYLTGHSHSLNIAVLPQIFMDAFVYHGCQIPRKFNHVVGGVSAVLAQCCAHQGAMVQAFLQTHASALLRKAELEQTYRHLILRLHTNLNEALAPMHMTLVALAHDALELCRELVSSRGSPSVAAAASLCLAKCRRFRSSSSFSWFVAQMREIYMALQPTSAVPIAPLALSASSPFNGTWGFNQLLAMSSSPPPQWLNPSMLTTLRASTMGLVGFRLALTTAPCCTLWVRAVSGTMGHPIVVPPSEFTLNGTPQILRVFPNGETTMEAMSSHLTGDYIGAYQLEASVGGRPSVDLSLFSWPLDAVDSDVHHVELGLRPRVCYRVQFHAILADPNSLHVRMQVFAAPERARGGDYWGFSVAQRLACYDTSNERLVVDVLGQYGRRRIPCPPTTNTT
ncbi:hypothetical protein H310_11577 [Aphanomyces invadans]|uniref:Uncharacterized protein n=1 Tax=Aphanomyces invadans TaxID=157072 RepID=A0A024TMV3_9STRA|nr:hypothetical protein H310_11577 [Aphanomyces invadans]ETV94931.1 hypothetical protein H310_11577 [Aphanomyces invadans]|eukprot:XP_008876522.1 hypothetical protein H310_11577 [Aphanomyces invadans]